MTLSFVTQDGAFAESWDMTMRSEDGATVSFYAQLDPSGFAGSFDLVDHVTATDYDELSAWVISASGVYRLRHPRSPMRRHRSTSL